MKNFFKFFLFFLFIVCILIVLIVTHRDIATFLHDGGAFVGSLFSKQHTIQDLLLENESLRQHITSLTVIREKKERYHYKIARVYSQYPFNDAASIIIDIGSDEGIKVGMPVMVKEGILLGKIKNVKRTQSEVETIFSPEWKISVNIGKEMIKAVLSGGPTPRVDLIPIDENVSFGDQVTNSVSDFPMGAFLGTVSEISKNTNDAWKKSALKVPYKIEFLNTVLVIVDFP
ncbi:MAG: rod shape-determining protein MreC [Patescibacteria group bacterium]